MFVAIFVASFFWSAALPQVEATTMSILKGDSGGYARLRIWGSLGFMLATLAGGYLIDHVGIKSLPVIVVVIMAGVAVLVWRVPEAGQPRHAIQTESMADILRRSEVRALFAACLLIGAAHGFLISFYSIHLDERGIAKSAMGWLWSAGIVAEIVIFWFMSRLSGRYSLRSLYLFAIGAAVIRYLLIGWVTMSMTVLFLAQLMHAFTFGIHHATSIAYVHRHFGITHQTKGQALYIVATFGIGGSIGTLLAGVLWDGLGGNWLFTLASAASALAWLICWRYLKEAE